MLRYLEFENSEGTDGIGTWEAMASVAEAHWPALQAEVAAVLAWARAAFGAAGARLDEGGDWDVDLSGVEEEVRPLRWQEAAGRGLCAEVDGLEPVQRRYTVTLTLSGSPAFCEALQAWLEAGAPNGG